MRRLVVSFLVAAVLLAGAPAWAQYNQAEQVPRQCVRIAKQLGRYARDAQWARERDNKLWEAASVQQAKRLEARLVDRCPEYASRDDKAMQKFLAKVIDIAAVVAWRYITQNYF